MGLRLRIASAEERGAGGFIDGGEALFIAETSLHVAPDRGGERGWKNGGVKTRSRPCNCSDARIFATRVAGGDACIFACVHVGAAIFGTRRRSPVRVCLSRAHGGGACISVCTHRGTARVSFHARMRPTRASFGCTHGGR